MCSSKFSAPKLAYKLPVVCKKPPPPSTLIAPPYPPLQLQAFVADKDWDPLAPRQDSQTFQLHKANTLAEYSGRSAITGDRYQLTIARIGLTDSWNLLLDIYDAYRNPETFFFPSVNIDPSKPFDSGLILEEVVPGEDFRMIRILE